MDIIIGTAGHIDHGKTALIRALTGVDADRLPEEKKRGITIDIGFAEMSIGDAKIGFVDVPGHERFVRNMLAGAHGIDHILLVVAATEGVMPQTREHFDICRLLNIASGTIVLTKCDLADEETRELAKLDIADLVADTFLENAEIIETSSISGQGIDELKNHLESVSARFVRPKSARSARLPIDRSFTVKGFGTVVTGTLLDGTLKVGDDVELLPEAKSVRIRGLRSYGKQADESAAGRRTAVNLGGVDHDEVNRGMVLAEAGAFRPTRAFDAKITMLPDASRPLRSRQRVRVHIGTAEVMARVKVLNDAGEIATGEIGFAQFRVETEAIGVIGDRFIVRTYSPQRTVAGGVIVDAFAARHRRKDLARIIESLGAIANARSDPERTALLIAASALYGATAEDLRYQTGVNAPTLRQCLSELIEGGEVTVVESRYYLTKFAPTKTVTKERIGIELSPAESDFRTRLIELLKSVGKEPPRSTAVIAEVSQDPSLPESRVNELLRLFAEDGVIAWVNDEFIFSTDVVNEIAQLLRDSASGDRTIDVSRFKELTGLSRKYSIPLLEYFDRMNITRRYGERRIIL
ncbi:MAG: selenocysteine-specific translation elongation factor [Blastocatellia bacterium]|nr:selenocysteine-specific translation elongation factor [Blastocatellia bacterium]